VGGAHPAKSLKVYYPSPLIRVPARFKVSSRVNPRKCTSPTSLTGVRKSERECKSVSPFR
jgi:hypothetical protein